MRIRSIKPEFWRSDDTASLADWNHRLIFIGLWSYVDDNGVGRDNAALIMSDLFPQENDPPEALARIRRALDELSRRKMIVRYTVNSKDYFNIPGWGHQKIDRPSKSPYPPPPTCVNEILDEHSTSTRRRLAPRAEDLGIKGSRDLGSEGSRESRTGAVAPEIPREDVGIICDQLADRIERNGSTRPTITTQWRKDARLLIDRDNRTVAEIIKVIEWSQSDSFWRSNILSMAKLREKFDQMRLRAAQPSRGPVMVGHANGQMRQEM